jgi:hypothetical protein
MLGFESKAVLWCSCHSNVRFYCPHSRLFRPFPRLHFHNEVCQFKLVSEEEQNLLMGKKWALTNSQTLDTWFSMIVCIMLIIAKSCISFSVLSRRGAYTAVLYIKTDGCYTGLRSIVLLQLPESCGCDQSVWWPKFSSACYNGAVQRGFGAWSPVHWTRPLHRICGELRVARTRL